jgi:hypothetical protein
MIVVSVECALLLEIRHVVERVGPLGPWDRCGGPRLRGILVETSTRTGSSAALRVDSLDSAINPRTEQ